MFQVFDDLPVLSPNLLSISSILLLFYNIRKIHGSYCSGAPRIDSFPDIPLSINYTRYPETCVAV